MFIYKNIFLTLASVLLVSACGSNDNNTSGDSEEEIPVETPKSFDVSYANAVVLGSNINDAAAIDSGPEVSANGLELYFHSDRADSEGGFDLYVSTRATEADNWGVASNLGISVNTADNERSPALTYDGLTLYFASDRTTVESQGDYDLYMITRATLSDPWSAPVNLGVNINTAAVESSPDISIDGLSLYFLSDGSGYGSNDIFVAKRASVTDSWPVPDNLGEKVNSADYEAAPEIASDGLTLYFHSDRDDPLGSHNIWRTTRATVNDAWRAPRALTTPVNSADVDVEPGLSYDWQTLYFARGTGSDRDIWQATP